MKRPYPWIHLPLFLALVACVGNRLEEKGFNQPQSGSDAEDAPYAGLHVDSAKLETRPSNVLLTGMPGVRLVSVYKVNRDRDGQRFIGSNNYHWTDHGLEATGDQWNNNYLPGMAAMYGYNLVNVAHLAVDSNLRKDFFAEPVLLRTLYYPAYSEDTLNGIPVQRNFFMVSVHDKDTNKDGRLTTKDLRHFYWFNGHGDQQGALVPANYSVFRSEYDPGNDDLYVFARLDENGNGSMEDHEAVHIFRVDLEDPGSAGRVY